MRTGFHFPSNTEDTNTGSCISKPSPWLLYIPSMTGCLSQQGRRAPVQKGTLHNVLQCSIFAILGPTTGEKTDMSLGNQERNLSYTLFINWNREQQQRVMQQDLCSRHRVRRNIHMPNLSGSAFHSWGPCEMPTGRSSQVRFLDMTDGLVS